MRGLVQLLIAPKGIEIPPVATAEIIAKITF